jgi:retinol dehydrogenase 12
MNNIILKQQDLSNKIILVTGATNGIGLETAKALAFAGATLILVARNQEKGLFVTKNLIKEFNNKKIEFIKADLSLQTEIKNMVRIFNEKYERLDILINNAGGYFPKRSETLEGIEMTFALNHLSYFLSANLLMDKLKASNEGKIINVSSSAHLFSKLDFDDIQMTKRYGGYKAYGRSKLCILLFTYELAKRVEKYGITVNALHPGIVDSGFGTGTGGLFQFTKPFFKIFGISPEKGARTSIFLSTSNDVKGISGKYFIKNIETKSSKFSYNETAQKQLWDISLQITNNNKNTIIYS